MMIRPPDSQSRFFELRGLRHHVRCWGDPARPWLLLGTGWLDCSASFGPLVAGLLEDHCVVSPDWRGTGLSGWPADGYWFPNYLADVDALLTALGAPEHLHFVGHSMGAQVLSLYAGARPEKARSLVLLDGLLLPDAPASKAPKQYRRWLQQVAKPRPPKRYANFETLAQRVKAQHPQLDDAWALFVAHSWGAADDDGQIRLLADPKHLHNMPTLHRLAESEAVWAEVTAPVLFIEAGRSVFHSAGEQSERPRRYAAFSKAAKCEVQTLPEAGHMLHWDAPEATAGLIRAFLKSIADRP